MSPEKHPIQKPLTTIAHILGNGDSISLFNRDEWEESNEFVGCNFSDIRFRPDYTVIMDAKPMFEVYGGMNIEIPVVLSDRCETFIVKDKKGWDKLRDEAFTFVDTITMIHDKANGYNFPMNSGHHATMYAIKRNEGVIKEVHLWGFNTFWSDDLKSNTDLIVKRNATNRSRPNPRVSNEWRKYWKTLFNTNSNISFIVHGAIEIDKYFIDVKNVKGVI
jgi:hypothetical protein